MREYWNVGGWIDVLHGIEAGSISHFAHGTGDFFPRCSGIGFDVFGGREDDFGEHVDIECGVRFFDGEVMHWIAEVVDARAKGSGWLWRGFDEETGERLSWAVAGLQVRAVVRDSGGVGIGVGGSMPDFVVDVHSSSSTFASSCRAAAVWLK